MTGWAQRFRTFVRRKEEEASGAPLAGFVTAEDRSAALPVTRLGTAWTEDRFDGPFYWTRRADGRSMNLVFVQSRHGNTVADDPSALGGGETDKHLVYEGLSRVHVDAVLAGSRTATGSSDLFFSVWHPELVRLRTALGKPRHPAQIVVSARPAPQLRDALLFNVPDTRAVLVTSDHGAALAAGWARTRPWVTVVATGSTIDLEAAMATLSREHDIRTVSAIGGRTIAASLIDAGLVEDLYLTTSPVTGGEADTPLHAAGGIAGSLVVRKHGRGREAGVLFEHFCLRA